MKFTILINQNAIVHGGFIGKTDLIDWAILDYISSWCLNKNAVRKLDYVWINYSHLLSEMPAIGINSKQVLSRRVSKIRLLGLIETIQDPDGRLYAKTTVLFNSIITINSESIPVNETSTPSTLESTPCELSTQHPCELSTQHPVNSKVDIQQTTNNKPSLSKPSGTINTDYLQNAEEETRAREKKPKQKKSAAASEKKEIEFTAEEQACYDWAIKDLNFWKPKITSRAKFLELYHKSDSGVRHQYNCFIELQTQKSLESATNTAQGIYSTNGGHYVTTNTHKQPYRKLSTAERQLAACQRAISREEQEKHQQQGGRVIN
jgi:hypothetical protein